MPAQRWSSLKRRKSENVFEPTTRAVLTDSQLISNYLAGDEHAFTELYNRYGSRVINFLYKKIGDKESSQDLCQETFVRVHRNLVHFNITCKFSAWLYTIAANLAKNQFRNKKRSRVHYYSDLSDVHVFEHDCAINLLDIRQDPSRDFEKAVASKMLSVAVEKLSNERKEVFVLRDLHGKTYAQIADMLNVAIGTVKSRLSRAREEIGISVRNQGYK